MRLLFILSTLPISSSAAALEFQTYRDDFLCGIQETYYGTPQITLDLSYSAEQQNYVLLISSPSWTLAYQQLYPLVIVMGNTQYTASGMGLAAGGEPGFMVAVGNDFVEAFAASRAIYIERQDGVTVANLSLEGSARAVSALRRCITIVDAAATPEARAQASREREAEALRVNPFINVPQAPRPPDARNRITTWVTEDDYPSAAIRDKSEGTVRYSLQISASGLVAGCTIVESSGSATLDDATCRNITRRARFDPTIGEDGQPTTGIYVGAFTWRLPDR